MVCRMALITNNPAFSPLTRDGAKLAAELVFVDGTAFAVLETARDKVHQGWRLLNHPLYGNLRPGHQPFRTLLLASPSRTARGARHGNVDLDSLRLLEQAIGVYEACRERWATPDAVSSVLFRDCSLLDRELMKATLSAYCA